MRETAAARLSRLLSLVPWLEQHQGVSVADAAAHFGVSPQELERDLWLTICCGLPGHGPDQLIDIQFWDDDGSIHVIDPQTLDRPLRLTASESMALLVGLRLLAQVPGDHDRAALASATAKLEAALGAGAGSGLDAGIVVDEADSDITRAIAEALTRRDALLIRYAGVGRDEISERVVEPADIVLHDGRRYLLAWCRSAGAQRTFRVDRIRAAEVLDDPVEARPIEASVLPTATQGVRLRVSMRSRWLLETLQTSEVIEREDGSIEATVQAADPEWLARLVLGQAGGAEVLGPPHTRNLVRDLARSALSRSG